MDLSSSKINKLLSSIKRILLHYSELSRIKQEDFNIFSILRKDYDEEKLHSAFIAEILDSKGSHKLGNVFLKLFIERFYRDSCTNNDNFEVSTEKPISNGRIDIYIKNTVSNELIIIENKIYAADQQHQLLKYHDHLMTFSRGRLFYLKLDGKVPDDISIEDENKKLEKDKDYSCLSYKEDIIPWLVDCLKEAAEHPTLRETIKQYITLIKKMTGQLTDEIMEKDILSLIKQNYSECRLITDNLWKVELEAAEQFVNEVTEKLRNHFNSPNWEIKIDEDLNKSWTGFYIRYLSWSPNVRISFQGQSKIAWNAVACGVIASRDDIDRDLINNKLNIKKTEYNRETAAYAMYHLNYNFSSPDERIKLINKSQRISLVNQLYDELIELAEFCKDKFEKLS